MGNFSKSEAEWSCQGSLGHGYVNELKETAARFSRQGSKMWGIANVLHGRNSRLNGAIVVSYFLLLFVIASSCIESRLILSQTSKLLPNDGSANDCFGRAVAISDDIVVIAARQDSDLGRHSGSAYVFEIDNKTRSWTQTAKLLPNDGAAYQYFGYSVAISDKTIIIGAYGDDEGGDSAGSAYIFEKNDESGAWIETAKLLANDASGEDEFGFSVAISNGIAVIGAVEDDDSGSSSGSAYVFEKNEENGTWVQTGKLVASNGNANDEFGYSVAISNGIIIVGARSDDDMGTDSGSAFIFEKGYNVGNNSNNSNNSNKNNGSDSSWIQTAQLLARDGQAYDYFGLSVSISDGVAIIGVYDDDDIGSAAGAAFIFEKDSETGTWMESAKLFATDGAANDYFGYSVSIANNIAIIGAYNDDDSGSASGSAYVFEKDDSPNGTWTQTIKLVASDGTSSDNFGYSVAIWNSLGVVGSYSDADNGDISGSAYIFDFDTPFRIKFESESDDNDNDNDNDVTLEFSCQIVGNSDTDWLSIDFVNGCESQNESMHNVTVLMSDTCILVSVSECDETESSAMNPSANHKYYTISMNDNIVAIGDYYDTYDNPQSNIICANPNVVSSCIIPNHCNNNNDLFSSGQSIVRMKSYHSMVNCSFDGSNSQDMSEWSCDGSYSCIKSDFEFGSDYDSMVLDCGGAYSCVDSTFKADYGIINCYGFGSCDNMIIETSDIFLHGFGSASFIELSEKYSNSERITMTAESSFVAVNAEIHLSSKEIEIDMGSESFSFYNVSIICDNPDNIIKCSINCDNSNTIQFLTIDDSCNNQCVVSNKSECSIINDIDEIEIDNATLTLIDDLVAISNNFINQYKTNDECSDSESISLDTGFAWYQDDDIVNNNDFGAVCCRAYESCAYANTMTSQYGNIYCSATLSCSDVDLIQTKNYFTDYEFGFIYCMGYQSCYASTLYSSNKIVCGTQLACQNTVIMGGNTLYCTKYACVGAVIRSVETIYIINEQSNMDIYSGSVSESYIYFRGSNSGNNIVYNCNDGGTCYIDCESDACNNVTTTLVCDGKCFVTCNGIFDNKECVNIVESLAPSSAPSNAPSNAPTVPPTIAPTYAPTTGDFITEEDISNWFNNVLLSVSGFLVVIIGLGRLDAFEIHKNHLFNWKSLVVFGFYSLDFFSDGFFNMKLYLEMIADTTDYRQVYIVLFIVSLTFLIVPIITNLYQLHREIKTWMHDPILKSTDTPLWILSKAKVLYFVAIICGSSFSAVALFNSYLFRLSIFAMGLSKYHQRKFRHKRFVSIVLLENVPQLFVQIATLILDVLQTDDYSSILIILVSMFFTLISMVLSVAEHFLSSHFIDYESSIVIMFKIESTTIAAFPKRVFYDKIVYQRITFVRYIAAILQLADSQCERLIPRQTTNGVNYTFAIATDQCKINEIRNAMKDAITNETLQKEYSKIYKFEERISIKDFQIFKLEDLYLNHEKEENGTEHELAQVINNNDKVATHASN